MSTETKEGIKCVIVLFAIMVVGFAILFTTINAVQASDYAIEHILLNLLGWIVMLSDFCMFMIGAGMIILWPGLSMLLILIGLLVMGLAAQMPQY